MTEELKRLIVEDEQKEIREIIANLPQAVMQESSFQPLPQIEEPSKITKTPDSEDNTAVEILKLGSEVAKMRNELRVIMNALNAIGHGIQESHRLLINNTDDKFRDISLKLEGIKRDIGGSK
jgi:hypothetical protein